MLIHILCFIAGVLLIPAVAWADVYIYRLGDWWRTKRGVTCPECKGDGYTEDVDVDSRSVSLWPCKCAKGRAYAKKLRSQN